MCFCVVVLYGGLWILYAGKIRKCQYLDSEGFPGRGMKKIHDNENRYCVSNKETCPRNIIKL